MASTADTNLLLISFDQWRGDWADPKTPVISLPALQSLASNGWSARRCYTSSPHCVPARMSWLTGLEPSQLGVTRNCNVSLPGDAPSMVRNLQEKGWHTAVIGKTHWTSHVQASNLQHNDKLFQQLGFNISCDIAGPRALRRIECTLTEAWRGAGVLAAQRADLERRYGRGRTSEAWTVRPTVLPNDLYPDIWIAEKGLEALKQMPRDRPWLLWIGFVGPHEPFDTPKPWHGLHENAELPPATQKPNWVNELPSNCELQQCIRAWQGRLSPSEVKACRADYADHLALLDTQVKRLINKLNTRDDHSRTAILATADHGELLGDCEMLYKACFLEGAVRVPFIYCPPSNKEQAVNRCFDTALPLTGLMRKILENLPKGGKIRPVVAWARRQPGAVVEFGQERLYVQGTRKLCVDAKGKALWATNLRNDPGEQKNQLHKLNQWHPKWWLLKDWAQKNQKERSNKSWVWRDLTNT